MNITKYKTLLTAVDTGSFSAAAQKLGYTQSGVTHMMNALEDEVGFPILQRGYFGIKLTPNGERIIARIRELVACEDALHNEIELIKSYGGSVLRVGAYSSMAGQWLPAIFEKFAEEFPDVTVNLQTGTVAELYAGLGDGRFDLVFGSRIPKYDFKYIPLWIDRFYAILPKNYVGRNGEFPVELFNGTKFLMPGLGFDDDINTVFAEYGVHPFVTPTYVDDPAIISMVEHNLGISMLSELILSKRHDNVNYVPIVPTVSRQLVIAYKEDKSLSPAERRLIAISKDFVKNYQSEIFSNVE